MGLIPTHRTGRRWYVLHILVDECVVSTTVLEEEGPPSSLLIEVPVRTSMVDHPLSLVRWDETTFHSKNVVFQGRVT